MNSSASFKECTMCSKQWQTRDDFIDDASLELNGYQADFEQLELGLFYFTHTTESCGSTIVIQTRDFLDLFTGKTYDQRETGGENCPLYCKDIEQLDRCDAFCECASVREVISIIRERQGRGQ